MTSLPLNITYKFGIDGRPNQVVQTHAIELPLPRDPLPAEGSLTWRVGVSLPGGEARAKQFVLRASEDEMTVTVRAHVDDVRDLLASKEAGSASVTLPLVTQWERGRELVRDDSGKATHAVDRQFGRLTWEVQ